MDDVSTDEDEGEFWSEGVVWRRSRRVERRERTPFRESDLRDGNAPRSDDAV